MLLVTVLDGGLLSVTVVVLLLDGGLLLVTGSSPVESGPIVGLTVGVAMGGVGSLARATLILTLFNCGGRSICLNSMLPDLVTCNFAIAVGYLNLVSIICTIVIAS